MKLLTLLTVYLLMPLVWGQEYRLSGEYLISGKEKAPVEFNLRWSQDNEDIRGEYSDDHYTESAAAIGSTISGSNITVVLPKASRGVKTITVLAPRLERKDTGRTVPVTIVTRDLTGTPLTTTEVSASFIALSEKQVAQRQEQAPDCVAQFGELSRVCGLYGGVVTEEVDASRSCDLTSAPAVRLEIDFLGEARLHLDEVNEVTTAPTHELGRLPAHPTSTSIDLLSRECRAISRVAFPADNCKRLNLTGTFSRAEGNWHFTGSYLITDEKTNRTCRYRFSLDQNQD